jgi:hypothetical protein
MATIKDYKEGGIPLQSTAKDVDGITRDLLWVVRGFDEEQIWDVRCSTGPHTSSVYSFNKDTEIQE